MIGKRRDRKAKPLSHKLRNVRNTLIIAVTLVLFFLLTGSAVIALTPLPDVQSPNPTRIYDRHDRLITTLQRGHNRTPIPIDDIPKLLQDAVIATEDARFYRHYGLDPIAIVRAAWRNYRAGKVVEGGSTITQQLAKKKYLSDERILSRKIQEAFLTLKLETQQGKTKILEMYLNEVYFGQGAYGVEAAAQTYFGKSARELNLSESATLAGLLQAPSYYDPRQDIGRAEARRNTVLALMAEQGYISRELAETTQRVPLQLAPPSPQRKQAEYFVDYVLDLLYKDRPDLAENVVAGGYRIYTTLDLDMQAAAEHAVQNYLVGGQPDAHGVIQPQAALVAIDPADGSIRAMIGGRSYAQSSLNRAVGGVEGRGRQPGSAFKPFLYTAVLAQGYTVVDRQMCEPTDYPGVDMSPWPTDYGDEPFHWRPVTLREAVEISDNVVAVKWANIIKPQTIIRTARAMGIDAPLGDDLSLALGAYEVTPLDLTAAYAPLANLGWRVEPLAIRAIEADDGRVVAQYRVQPVKVLDERVAYVMTNVLEGVIRNGTGRSLQPIIGRPAAGKTGTTENNRDAWFVGYTPELVTGVWVGHDTPRSLPGVGSTLAGPVWAHFMRDALANRPVTHFPRPAGVIDVQVSSLDGLLPNFFSPVETEVFIEGTEPEQVSPLAPWADWFPEDPYRFLDPFTTPGDENDTGVESDDEEEDQSRQSPQRRGEGSGTDGRGDRFEDGSAAEEEAGAQDRTDDDDIAENEDDPTNQTLGPRSLFNRTAQRLSPLGRWLQRSFGQE